MSKLNWGAAVTLLHTIPRPFCTGAAVSAPVAWQALSIAAFDWWPADDAFVRQMDSAVQHFWKMQDSFTIAFACFILSRGVTPPNPAAPCLPVPLHGMHNQR